MVFESISQIQCSVCSKILPLSHAHILMKKKRISAIGVLNQLLDPLLISSIINQGMRWMEGDCLIASTERPHSSMVRTACVIHSVHGSDYPMRQGTDSLRWSLHLNMNVGKGLKVQLSWDTNTHRRKLPGRRNNHLHRWFCSEWGEIVMGIHRIKLWSHHTGRIRSNRCHRLKHVHGNQSNHRSTELALQ